MLSLYVGEEKFLKGVSLYLKDHRFGNSVTEDLWAGIGKATGTDIPKMMDNWVKKVLIEVVCGVIPSLTAHLLDGFPCDHCQGSRRWHSRTTRPLLGNRTRSSGTQ